MGGQGCPLCQCLSPWQQGQTEAEKSNAFAHRGIRSQPRPRAKESGMYGRRCLNCEAQVAMAPCPTPQGASMYSEN